MNLQITYRVLFVYILYMKDIEVLVWEGLKRGNSIYRGGK